MTFSLVGWCSFVPTYNFSWWLGGVFFQLGCVRQFRFLGQFTFTLALCHNIPNIHVWVLFGEGWLEQFKTESNELRPKIKHTKIDFSFCSSFIGSTANIMHFIDTAFFFHKNKYTGWNPAFKLAGAHPTMKIQKINPLSFVLFLYIFWLDPCS